MKFSTVLVLTSLFFFGCQQEKVVSSSLLPYVPQNASAIVKVNDLSSFKSELKNNDFLSKLKGTKLHTAVFDKLKGLDYIQTNAESIIAFTELGKDNLEFIYAVSQPADFLQLTDISDKTIETVSYEQHSYKKYTIEGLVFYGTVMDDKAIISSSPILLENLIRKRGEVGMLGPLKKLYEIANTDKSATFFINTRNGDPLISSILKEDSKVSVSQFSDWVSLDLSMGQDHINFNGIAMANDSLKRFTNLFWKTGPLPHATPAFAPIAADGFLSYTFDNYDVFAKNQQKYLDRSTPMDTIFNTVEEVGIIYLNTKKAVVLNTYGSENISQFLDGLKRGAQDYQGTEITALTNNDFLQEIFDPLIQNFKANYYAILENAFVFSSDKESLQTVISNFKNSSTYNKAPSFEAAKEVLADESNLLFVTDDKGIRQITKEDFSSELLQDLQRAKLSKYAFAGQLVTDETFYHTNLVLRKIGKEAKLNTTSPLFTVQLDSDLATTPQFVVNHRTNKKEIVVQDKDNYIYLISTTGKVLWKKQLDGRIQGKIAQVDIYRNGRLQLAFTTDNQFLILDRNGKEVPPFTQKFEGGNLNPLAVFDYERKKDYRFVVTQGNKVYMYNNKGAIVSGFKYTKAESPITRVPRHFRVGKRDYLCFVLEDNTLKILNRVGDVRTRVSEKIDFSENEAYLYKNKFSITDKKGTLFQIDEAGKITKSNFNLNKDHGMDATSKTLALMNDNILSIKGKKVELDLGVYTKPKIFYLYDKIYVSVTDIQSQKIHLFDSNAKPIQNFPVYGNSLIDLADMDNDRKLELVAKDLENSLIIYKMN